jgi:hypothetical protein
VIDSGEASTMVISPNNSKDMACERLILSLYINYSFLLMILLITVDSRNIHKKKNIKYSFKVNLVNVGKASWVIAMHITVNVASMK